MSSSYSVPSRPPVFERGVAGQAFDVRVRLRREAAAFGVYETDYSVAVVESRVGVVTNVPLVE